MGPYVVVASGSVPWYATNSFLLSACASVSLEQHSYVAPLASHPSGSSRGEQGQAGVTGHTGPCGRPAKNDDTQDQYHVN